MSRSRAVFFCLIVLSFSPVLARAADALAQQTEMMQSGKPPDSACREILNSSSQDWKGYADAGRCHFAAGDYMQAATSFEKAAQLRPDDLETMNWLGRSYLQDRQPEKVLEYVKHLSAATANSAVAHFLLARAYDAQDKLDEARRELQLAMDANPQVHGAHFALGFIAWTIRDLATAEQEFRRELKSNPRMDMAYYYLAEALEVQGKIDEAEAVISQMGREVPDSYFCYFGVGKLHEQKRDFAKAVESFRKATQIDPDNPEGHYRLGLALRKMGETAQANAELELHNKIRARMCPMCGQGMGRMRPHLPDFS
jgi:tetratricopeptide (TPR) repeat protein